MIEDDLVTDKEIDEKKDDEDEPGNSDSKTRQDIHVKMRYGTKRFSSDTDCTSCGEKADGVLLIRDGEYGKLKAGYDGEYCETCRAVRTRELEVSEEEFEFPKFAKEDN